MSSVRTPSSSIQQRVQSALGRWRGTLATDDRDLFESFVNHALRRIRGPFLAQHHPTQVLRHLERAFEFAQVRQQDEVKVAVRSGDTKGVVALSNMPDQPFIIDTIRMFFRRNDADYWGGFHVVIHANRDEDGRLVSVGKGGTAESIVLLEADIGDLIYDLPGAANNLRENLALARAMVGDFRLMTRTVERVSEKFDLAADRAPQLSAPWRETSAFLQWLLRENFVFMGIEQLSADGAADKLGIQTLDSSFYNDVRGVWPPPHPTATVQVRKGMCESPVHRAGRIDEILVRLPAQWDDQILFIRGMFTYRAVTQPSRNVPILRRILGEILEESESQPGSFRYKGIANVFDSLPTEFLFTATEDAITKMVDLVFEAEQQQEVGVTFLMLGPQSAFSLVAMPKSQFSDELRKDLQKEIIGTVQATYSDHGLFVGRYETVLLYYYLTGVSEQAPERLQQLSERVRALATPWLARLWQSLSERFDEATADRLADTYGQAFPADWVRSTAADRAVQDILVLESLGGRRTPSADVFAVTDDQLMIRLYEPVDLYLTEVLPVLDNFGVVVHDAFATDVHSRGGHMRMDSFRLAPMEAAEHASLLSRRQLLIDAIEAVFADEVETDQLDALVLKAGLAWREVDVVRGYQRYMRQLQIKVAQSRVQEILLSKPELVANLIALFRARFDPDLEGDRAKVIRVCSEAVDDHLRRIRAHDQDLVFGTLASLIRGTLRTNFYREDKPFHYLSFKFDCQNMKEFAGARHMYEIYVHNKDVEGVHIRFGPVSRGGLRWSDRDDFRTEVLGLASTQQKKNVVIVPEGSKGGFYLRNPTSDRSARRAEADRHYETLIRGMLDLTDNAVGGKPERPPRVVCHDGMDPYLVVAADKGTAHLSDTANSISRSYGYWLDDAFASGGSNGYDHKEVGITARGAWVLVARHFAEAGLNPYTTPFTCAGIGDMGGDVFGNGLIETPHTKLFAAFNHLHIFLDPDPDPTSSYEERVRLFKIAGRKAGWDHYNTDLISAGGGVFDRSAKTIPLSPQAQQMLDLEQAEAPPDVVMNHILKLNVDLLWNGGIGTYVMASHETHADADDRSNDTIRVRATELRARIVGEGGNLGFTQEGRIEAGRHGLRLNTDAIDNSGGVDMSDHEVNLKILLNGLVELGTLDEAQRNTLLEQLTVEVADHVLANNNAHGRQLSRDQIRSEMDIFQFGHAISFVERTFGVRREALDLPTVAELNARAEAGEGLTRPELAVLGAFVKMYVYKELMGHDPKSTPGYEDLLMEYFPKAVAELYPDAIRNHMLADEIAMTVATTRVIADGGAALIPIMIETTGASVPLIVKAFLMAQRLGRVDEVRSTLEDMRTKVSLKLLNESFVRCIEGTRMMAMFWLSARGRLPTDEELQSMAVSVDEYDQLQPADAAKKARGVVADLLHQDMPEHVAELIVKSRYLNLAVMAWALSRNEGEDLAQAIIKLQAVGRGSRLLEVIEDLAVRPASGQWEPIALRILFIRFLHLLRKLIPTQAKGMPIQSVDQLQPLLENQSLGPVRAQVDDLLDGEEVPSPATLLVLEERVAAVMSRMA